MAAKRSQSDEDYWQSSRATHISKNPFDDDVDYDSARKILKNSLFNDEDEEEADIINWDGSAISSSKVVLEARSARFRPAPDGGGGGGGNYPSNQGDTRGIRKPEFTPSGLHQDAGREMTIADVVGTSAPKKAPSLTEMAKLEAEINCLKRNLEAARKDKYARIPPRDLVRRMIMGQPYSLEMYKSKEDKLSLLDESIRHHDGNVITAAILFLRDTVKAAIFNVELMRRPLAIEHYLNYLLQHYDFDKYLDMLGMLGRTEDAAMFKYKQSAGVKDASNKIRNLQACYQAHFQSEPMLAHEANLVQEQISLLERQLPVEAADVQEVQRGDMRFKETPRVATIIDQPVITTLFYSCLYHYNLAENSLASPLAIRKAHKLTERQYTWTALQARAKLKQWNDIEALFQTKTIMFRPKVRISFELQGWLGGTKMKAVVGYDRMVPVLSRLGAPRTVLNKYCKLIEPSDHRIQTGTKYSCHETVLETFMQQKDRHALMAYQAKLQPQSQEWFYAKDILQNSSVKWKN